MSWLLFDFEGIFWGFLTLSVNVVFLMWGFKGFFSPRSDEFQEISSKKKVGPIALLAKFFVLGLMIFLALGWRKVSPLSFVVGAVLVLVGLTLATYLRSVRLRRR